MEITRSMLANQGKDGQETDSLVDLSQLLPQHLADLRKSGLSNEAITACGFHSLTDPEQIQRVLRWKHYQGQLGPCLAIPFRDAQGKLLDYCRLKPDRPRSNEGGKAIKYESPKGVANQPYFPPGALALLNDVSQTLIITEGEKKAAKADQEGFPCIGLVGVYGWQKRRPRGPDGKRTGERQLIDALSSIPWQGRRVPLCYDSDLVEKPEVRWAEWHLAEALAKRGAIVKFVRLPSGEPGPAGKPAKVGLDDFLVAHDPEAFRALLNEAKDPVRPDSSEVVLQRLRELLAMGNAAERAAALFRDKDLLTVLARLAEDNPAEFAVCRAMLHGAGIRLTDLNAALKPLKHRRRRPPTAAYIYQVEGGRICRVWHPQEGEPELTPLANFAAGITEVIVHDDGAEHHVFLALEGRLADGTPLPIVKVPAEEYAALGWVLPGWGPRAVILAGQGTKDHMRAAMQLLSGDPPQRTVYTHTGWHRLSEGWVYLHASGAIGPDGPIKHLEVSLPDALSGFELPMPPGEQQLADAVRASLGLLCGLAPDRIMFPLLCEVYRAVLGDCDFSEHLLGDSGFFKSELAALCQQHYGPGLNARQLPGNWSSTENALEDIAFTAKDALLVIDDFRPRGSIHEVQSYHRKADRVIRAQGNRAGRQRLDRNGNLRAERPPRGAVLSTGEDSPHGPSVQARLLTLQVGPKDVDRQRLTACQRDAAAGLYARALAAFIRWLAPQYLAIRRRMRGEVSDLREKAWTEGQHARTASIVADLALGLKYFLDFALSAGAITPEDQAELTKRAWQALVGAAGAQAGHVRAVEPAGRFVELLAAALASGRAHVAGPDGNEPKDPEAWGWRKRSFGIRENELVEWQPQGRRIGWIEGSALYLEPNAAFAEAQRLAAEQGESLSVGSRTMHSRLKEKGLLTETDAARGTATVRRTLEGRRREVLSLQAAAILSQETDQTDQERGNAERNGQFAGQFSPDGPRN